MATKAYDIALLPEPALAAKAIRSSQELAPMGTEFTLGQEQYVPHVSLYMLPIKSSDLPAVCDKLAALAAQTPQIALEAKDYFQNNGYIGMDYPRTAQIDELQQAVLQAANPHRDGLRQESEAYLQTATGQTQKNLEAFGYESVGELFIPHLTFTRFSNHLPIPLEDMGAATAFSGTFISLAIYELGPEGTCLHKIAEFRLQ